MALAGRGIDKDPAQAERWLRQDAETGDAQSAGRLAMAYLLGEFGEADEQQGGDWMRRGMRASPCRLTAPSATRSPRLSVAISSTMPTSTTPSSTASRGSSTR
jgi:hypothetical protein